jgi:SAM-dependent methyltransferase
MPTSRRTHVSTMRQVLPTIAIYERSANEFLTRWGRGRYRRPPLLMSWLAHLPPNATLLDLGCGGGQDARYLQQRDYRVVGLDCTAALLSFARHRSTMLPLIRADVRRLPLRTGCVDGVWAAASLIHLPKAQARTVLAELLRLTRPGGILGSTLTHGKKSRVVTRGWIPGRYFARWKKDELGRAVQNAGWRVIRLDVVTSRERKGRWINVVAINPGGMRAKSSSRR